MSAFPNLRHLRAVVEVAQQGSVSAAARTLYVSQPAVTQALATLEHKLGISLFSRAPSGVTPTHAGIVWIDRVRRALGHLQEGVEEIDRGARHGADGLQGITVAQLKSLVAIVAQGGFGRAARAEGLARATVHRAARQLEAVLGVELFERTSYGVRPTREGERLARRVDLAAAELRQGWAELAALAGIDRGMTVVGAMPLSRSAIVPGAVLEFASVHPRHVVTILDGPYESMLGELRHGRADVLVGALREAPSRDIVQEHLFDDVLAIIVRRGHPLVASACGRAPGLGDLVRYPWIAPREGSPLRRHFKHLFGDAIGEPPAAPIECNSLVAARAMLLASDRVMLLSAHQVHDDLRSESLVALPHPAGRVVRSIGLTVRRDWHPTTAQSALLEILRRVTQRLGEQVRLHDSKPPRARKVRGETPMRRVKNRVKYTGSSKPRL